ncbi:Uncharacterized protein TCM_036728 [Theobroma cacao]|uniref:Retrotransposon gag domain-containing protein n=1 Tax=Theobroma cacao TaxID=3641 RepID=A0A061FKR8_THECC|nr:Uncharacterized protein TCM_036728 [Theobroma cacao]
MVTSWLLNVVSKDIAASIFYTSSANEIWLDLHDWFSPKILPPIFEICCNISLYNQKNNSVVAYYTVLKGLWNELATYRSLPTSTCGTHKKFIKLQEADHLMQLLMGLNDSNT